MEISEILSRLSEEQLTKFLNKAVIKVLKIEDPSAIHLRNLTELIEKSIEVHTVLQDATTRNILIEGMRNDESERFAEHLGIKINGDVKYNLMKTKFTIKIMRKALNFFDKEFDEERYMIRKDLENIQPETPLFPHQLATIKKLKILLSKKPHKALLHMPTGSGKTKSAMRVVVLHLLDNPNALVIWLAHNEELCEQAIQEFQQTWKNAGDREISTYRFFKESKLDPLKIHEGFMAASLLKMLSSARKNNQFLSKIAQKTSFVIIDEAHQAPADKYSIVIEELAQDPDAKLLGLSATPGGSTETRIRDLVKFFSYKKVMLDTGKENPVKFLIKNGYLAKPQFNILGDFESNLSDTDIKKINASMDIPANILEKLSQNDKRNIEITREIKRLAKIHKKIIVFAANIEHARTISLILSAQDYTSHYITKNTPTGIRAKILDNYKNRDEPMILCNYGILTMGFDAPKTSAVVIARPTKSYVLYAQMVGRGIRGTKAGGNKNCEISTISDDDIKDFIEVTKTFTQWEKAWNEQS